MGSGTRPLAFLLLAAAAGACTYYAPVGSERPTPGRLVRAHLAEPMEVVLDEITVRDASAVEGQLVRWDGDSLVISAQAVRSAGGRRHRGVGELVAIPVGRLRFVEERRLSTRKTLLLAGGVAAGSAAVVELLFGGGGGGGEPTGGGEPVESARFPPP